MDKNKKKITSAFFIMLIIVVLAVTGYYVINKKITQDAADEVKLPNTEYGKLLAKDLDTACRILESIPSVNVGLVGCAQRARSTRW